MTARRFIRLSVVGVAVACAAAACVPEMGVPVRTAVVQVAGVDAGAAPDVFAGDDNAQVTLSIANTSPTQILGSANITVPAPYSLVASANDTVPGGPVIELRNLGLAPGATVTVSMTVDVQTCVPSAPAPFGVELQQSESFDNSEAVFSVAPGSDLQLDAAGACSLAFVGQPADAAADTAITSAAFDPGGPPITVQVLDAGSTGRATHSTAAISLSAQSVSEPSPLLGGTTSASAVDGLATFAPGPTLVTGADDYTLNASSPGLVSSPPSSTFSITATAVPCLAGEPCSATATASGGGQTATAEFGPGGSDVSLVLRVSPPDAPPFECPDYPRGEGTVVTQFFFTGGDASDRIGYLTTSFPSPDSEPDFYDIEVCWAAPYPFLAKVGESLTTAGVQGVKPGTTDPLYVGVLPDCESDEDSYLPPPCVSSRSYDSETNLISIEVKTTGADPWRY